MRWVLVVIIISILVLGPTLGTVVEADSSYNDAYFYSDPLFDDVNRPININNASYSDTIINEWEEDLGVYMPNGTYYGGLLSPALFEHSLRPTSGDGQRFTGVILSSHFEFDSQTIMSGCSEWWVRLPFNPDVMSKGVLSVFKDCDNSSLITFEDDFLYYETEDDFVRPSNGGYMPYDFIPFALGGGARKGEGFVVEDRMYLKVHSILRPDVDYVISFSFAMSSGELQTYWTTGEKVCGGWSSIAVAEIELSDNINSTIHVDVLDTEIMDVALDLDWSFMFTEGIGAGGLFGYNLNLDIITNETGWTKNESLTLYPYFDLTDCNDDIGQYMSFMLPFISDDSVWAKPAVYNGMQFSSVSGMHLWYFGPVVAGPPPIPNNISFTPDYGYEYYDFILFSTNETVVYNVPVGAFDGFHGNDRYNVRLTFFFNQSLDITLLCHERDDTPVEWSDFRLFWNGVYYDIQHYANRSLNPYMRPWIREYDGTYEDYTMAEYYLGYEIWCSAGGTEGQWYQQFADAATGEKIYTYHFPQVISLSRGDYRIIGENQTEEVLEEWERLWKLAQDEWGAWHHLSAIRYAFMSVITRAWDGGEAIIGYISDGLSRVWKAMASLGKWIYTKIVEFVGKIYDFLQEFGDHLVTFWDSLKYVVAPMMMVTIISYSTKFSKTARRDGE